MTKSSISIEILPGINIQDAFVEAVRLANMLDVNVSFIFNGTYCLAKPNSDPVILVKRYHDKIRATELL